MTNMWCGCTQLWPKCSGRSENHKSSNYRWPYPPVAVLLFSLIPFIISTFFPSWISLALSGLCFTGLFYWIGRSTWSSSLVLEWRSKVFLQAARFLDTQHCQSTRSCTESTIIILFIFFTSWKLSKVLNNGCNGFSFGAGNGQVLKQKDCFSGVLDIIIF